MNGRTRAGLAVLSLVAFRFTGFAQVPAPAPAPALAQAQAQARSLALTQPMPVDPAITIGRLPNGLRYYLRTNTLPEKRVELRLAVNAGSVLEDEDQLGLAHMLEHMAFNGTKHFQKQELVAFMESIGMRFGPSLNAFTSFDETVYMLRLPTDKPETLEKGFDILEDWAQNLSFDPVEIDKERGVIVEEWRLGRGAGARMRDKQLPVLLKGARYADRLPIGTKESIDTFKHDALKRFYREWYRPDLMAVVAVGDADKATMKALVERHFGAIQTVKVPRLRPRFDVPAHPDTLYTVASDKEATMAQVTVYNKMPAREQGSVAVYRDQTVERLASSMLSARLANLAQKPDAPFVAASAGRGRFVRRLEAATLTAVPKEGAADRALEALLVEAERAARFGFTATELEREKRATLRRYEQYFAEKDKHESAVLADEFVRNFTQNETLPGPALELALHQRFLPEITLAEVNKLAAGWTAPANRVVLANGPDKPGVAIPDESKLAAAVKAASSAAIAAYVDDLAGTTLLEAIPAPGSVVRTAVRPAAGITEWTLSNGAKVALKPTDFKQDEVVFRAFSPGGISLAADADWVAAATAAQVVRVTGAGRFSAIDLRKVLAGKIASVGPSITETEEGLSGSGSPRDLETLFQLIYLHFTAPRADAGAFAAFTAQGRAVLANQQASPAWAFTEAMNGVLTGNHPRGRQMTPELIGQMDMDKSLAFFRDRFADASDFTFVFVGSFEPDSIRPLVERYLASLPSLARKESWKDVGIRPLPGLVEKTVRKGLEPKSQAAIVFTGPFDYNQRTRIAMRALGTVLETRLRETLREDLSGTYGVSVSPGYAKFPEERYTFSITWGCDPKRTEELAKAVFREIEALQARGVTEKQLSDVRAAFLRDYETNTKQNMYVLNQIYLRYQQGEDPDEFFRLREYYEKLDAKAIDEAARRYLDRAAYIKVVLLPDAPAQQEVKQPVFDYTMACFR